VNEGVLGARYRAIRLRKRAILAALGLLALAAFLLDLSTGPAALSGRELIEGILDPASLTPRRRIILWDIRLPDALMALIVGAALALGGIETQTALNNPLASPFTLGLSAAAGLGASLAIVLGLPGLGLPAQYVLPALAFLGALAAGLAVLFLATLYGGAIGVLILFGIAMLFLCEALTAILQFVASDEAVRQIVFWRIGDLTRAGWAEVAVVGAVLALVFPFSFAGHAAFTAIRGGEEIARGAGLDIARIRRRAILRTCLLTAVAVCFVGAIGFVGLVGPHIARLLLGEDHRYLIPGSALSGAALLALASFASKSVVPGIIVPVGITTAIIGVPVFVALIVTQKRAQA
jgi:iron complex transport system permease protein